jgi:hypothetical protein
MKLPHDQICNKGKHNKRDNPEQQVRPVEKHHFSNCSHGAETASLGKEIPRQAPP